MSNPFYPFWQQVEDLLSEHTPKVIVWCIYIVVLFGILKMCSVFIDRCNIPQSQENNVTEIRVHFCDHDSIVPIIRQELDCLKQTVESIRKDSISIKVSKVYSK